MNEYVTNIAKAKIADATTILQSWKFLNLDYENLQEFGAKLKEQVKGLKLKASMNPAKILEVFYELQVIAAIIKATWSISLLENNKDYTALIGKHLSNEVM